MSKFIEDLIIELAKAENKHTPLHSGHEAYSVILEELEEFWDEVKSQKLDKIKARKELIQVAAMSWRAVKDLKLED